MSLSDDEKRAIAKQRYGKPFDIEKIVPRVTPKSYVLLEIERRQREWEVTQQKQNQVVQQITRRKK